MAFVKHDFNVPFVKVFPLLSIPVALVVVVLVTLLVIRPTLRRATRIEARAVLTALLEQTQNFTLDPDHDPQWVDSLLVRRHEQLHLRVNH